MEVVKSVRSRNTPNPHQLLLIYICDGADAPLKETKAHQIYVRVSVKKWTATRQWHTTDKINPGVISCDVTCPGFLH